MMRNYKETSLMVKFSHKNSTIGIIHPLRTRLKTFALHGRWSRYFSLIERSAQI